MNHETKTSLNPLPKPPEVLRDEHGRIVWKLPNNTADQNLQLGIRNIQGLFLLRFPGFGAFLVLNSDGNFEVAKDKKEEAENFFHINIPGQKAFHKIMGGSASSKKIAPYFEGSFQKALTFSFTPWGVTINFKNRGRGFWQNEGIRAEALKYYEEHSDLSRRGLIANNQSSLATAISRKYPGGFFQLKTDLGIEAKKPPGYWTEESIRQEALKFYNRFGNISENALSNQDRYDLAIAITTKYPGSFQKLREDLGLDNRQKAKGFWTEQTIEDEARKFCDEYGDISLPLLIQHGRQDIVGAVKKYPGQLTGLKQKLGIAEFYQEEPIPPDQANEQLAKLLEAAK